MCHSRGTLRWQRSRRARQAITITNVCTKPITRYTILSVPCPPISAEVYVVNLIQSLGELVPGMESCATYAEFFAMLSLPCSADGYNILKSSVRKALISLTDTSSGSITAGPFRRSFFTIYRGRASTISHVKSVVWGSMLSKLRMLICAQKGQLCQPTIVVKYVVLDGEKVNFGG